MTFKKHLLIIFMLSICSMLSPALHAQNNNEKKPKLTVVLIVDQLAHHCLKKYQKHLTHGLKNLLNDGLVYHNTFHPHGVPETTPGHHALSTGVLPKDHGAVLNQWLSKDCKRTPYPEDNRPEALIFAPGGTLYKKGRSSQRTVVDTISDRFITSGNEDHPHKSFALAIKGYPAISMAGRQGKALWLDYHSGWFTSSKYYFDQLPAWLTKFNNLKKVDKLTHFNWKPIYKKNHKAYNYRFARNYDYAGYKFSMIDRHKLPIDHTKKYPYDFFIKSPAASKYLLDLGKSVIKHELNTKKEAMLLWISLSNFDLLGHFYGPESMEAMDLLYHIDRQISDFLKHVYKKVGKENVLVLLTADHGVSPIPELMKKRGDKKARRILAKPLIKRMNKFVKKKYGTNKVVSCFEPTHFRLNQKILETQSEAMQDAIKNDLKKFLMKEPGIKKAWLAQELKSLSFEPDHLEQFYKNQAFAGRTGDLVVQPEPYVQITHYPTGTSHMTPYDYDTHVPLIIFQHNRFEKKEFVEKVWTPQVPVTLAHLLGVPRPSASQYNILPGVK